MWGWEGTNKGASHHTTGLKLVWGCGGGEWALVYVQGSTFTVKFVEKIKSRGELLRQQQSKRAQESHSKRTGTLRCYPRLTGREAEDCNL